jgi:hypothetical protein
VFETIAQLEESLKKTNVFVLETGAQVKFKRKKVTM